MRCGRRASSAPFSSGGGVNAALDFVDRACRALPADVPLHVAGAWVNERAALAPGTWQYMPRESMVPRLAHENQMFLDRAVHLLMRRWPPIRRRSRRSGFHTIEITLIGHRGEVHARRGSLR